MVLLVMHPQTDGIGGWGDTLTRIFQNSNAEAITVASVIEAQEALLDQRYKFDHVITGTMDDEWPTVWEACATAGVPMSIFTAAPGIKKRLKELGLRDLVGIINKDHFDREVSLGDIISHRRKEL